MLVLGTSYTHELLGQGRRLGLDQITQKNGTETLIDYFQQFPLFPTSNKKL